MTIFGIMVCFILEILFVVKLGKNSSMLWEKCEDELNESIETEEISRKKCRGPSEDFKPHRLETRKVYERLLGSVGCCTLPDITPLAVSEFTRARFLLRFDRLKLRFVRHAHVQGFVPKSSRAKWAGDTAWDEIFPETPGGEPQPKRHRWVPAAMTGFDMATYFKRWQSQVFEELVCTINRPLITMHD